MCVNCIMAKNTLEHGNEILLECECGCGFLRVTKSKYKAKKDEDNVEQSYYISYYSNYRLKKRDLSAYSLILNEKQFNDFIKGLQQMQAA